MVDARRDTRKKDGRLLFLSCAASTAIEYRTCRRRMTHARLSFLASGASPPPRHQELTRVSDACGVLMKADAARIIATPLHFRVQLQCERVEAIQAEQTVGRARDYHRHRHLLDRAGVLHFLTSQSLANQSPLSSLHSRGQPTWHTLLCGFCSWSRCGGPDRKSLSPMALCAASLLHRSWTPMSRAFATRHCRQDARVVLLCATLIPLKTIETCLPPSATMRRATPLQTATC